MKLLSMKTFSIANRNYFPYKWNNYRTFVQLTRHIVQTYTKAFLHAKMTTFLIVCLYSSTRTVQVIFMMGLKRKEKMKYLAFPFFHKYILNSVVYHKTCFFIIFDSFVQNTQFTLMILYRIYDPSKTSNTLYLSFFSSSKCH